MRMPSVTIRGMMFAIAIVAVALGTGVGAARLRLRVVYRQRAAYHGRAMLLARSNLKGPMGRKRGEYHARMRDKYERLTVQPWMAAEPGPHPPE